jgi:hypothetical protein
MGISIEDLVAMQKRLAGNSRQPNGEHLASSKSTPRIKDALSKAPQHAAVLLACFESDGIPAPVFEHRFHPVRKWRFDVAWPDRRLAVEIQGGLFKGRTCPECGNRAGGRHNRAAAMLREFEKLNAAAVLGWRVLYFTPEAIRTRAAMDLIRASLQVQ